MNAKRVTALIMASVMAFGITACGTGSKEENTKETAQETAAEEATEAVAETVGEEAATAEEAIEDEVEENVETASEMATEASLEDADEKELNSRSLTTRFLMKTENPIIQQSMPWKVRSETPLPCWFW